MLEKLISTSTSPANETTAILWLESLVPSNIKSTKFFAASIASVNLLPDILPDLSITKTVSEVCSPSIPVRVNSISQRLHSPSTFIAVLVSSMYPGFPSAILPYSPLGCTAIIDMVFSPGVDVLAFS